MKEMPKVFECMMEDCAYNKTERCHAMAITVGNGTCPLCDTAIKSTHKGGVMDMMGGVGVCKIEDCQYNDSLECNARGIRIVLYDLHAECGTFKAK